MGPDKLSRLHEKNDKNVEGVARARGRLNENRVESILSEMKEKGTVSSYRPATDSEDKQGYDFFIEKELSDGSTAVIGIQVKSSDYGAMNFKKKNSRFSKETGKTPILVFTVHAAEEDAKETRRRFVRAVRSFTKKIESTKNPRN
ncbi:MAG: hypothetical protein PHP35_00885 [Candidatus Colwellbacteria bacterium]|nr:hypothetical protein [Candidatus Colwellbacteria bacterium]